MASPTAFIGWWYSGFDGLSLEPLAAMTSALRLKLSGFQDGPAAPNRSANELTEASAWLIDAQPAHFGGIRADDLPLNVK